MQVFRVEKLVSGGSGLIHDGPNAIFVPAVIPGEMVRIQIEPGTKKPIRAKVLDIVTPSLDRALPPCPLFGACGGCQLQHIAYPAQVKLKKNILAETIERIAGLTLEPDPVWPSPRSFHYRSRLKFHVRRAEPGFFGQGEKDFLPISSCHLAREELNRVMPSLKKLIWRERAKIVELILSERGRFAAIRSDEKRRVFKRSEEDDAENPWAPATFEKVAFSQVNPEQNQALLEVVAGLVAGIKPRLAIELYAGAGNLTAAMVPHCMQIMAEDSNLDSIKEAQEKFFQQGHDQVRFAIYNDVTFLDNLLRDGHKPDLCLLDPPRTGARNAMPRLLELEPPNIIYVSCDPATLARDLKTLKAKYQVKKIIPLDMFPQTSHIETVAWLSK